jgi:hypothetical protein
VTTPTTKAGRALLDDWEAWTGYGHWAGCAVWSEPMLNDCTCDFGNDRMESRLLAIEQEAWASLVDRARANHVRWEHEAELLEECTRTLCLGAKVLLWPDPEAMA